MGLLQSAFQCVSDRSRQRKLELFYALMRPTKASRVLDLGGEVSESAQPHKQLLTDYPYREGLVLVNLFFPCVQSASRLVPGLQTLCADGMRLPFNDKAFDICYCNAVVEHLRTRANQVAFAKEIMRVSRSWFVTTPNRWFPFEPHMRLPFVSWTPQSWQWRIGGFYGWHGRRHCYRRGIDYTDLCLLGRRGLRRLFPGSRIIRNGIVGATPTLIAVGGETLREAQGERITADATAKASTALASGSQS